LISFTESVDTFLEGATWLTDVDIPMVTALQKAAEELDSNGVQAALLNTFGVTYRTLLKRAGDSHGPVSEEEEFLNGL
jgi:hypothetical protein